MSKKFKHTAHVKTITFEIEVAGKTYFVLFSFEYNAWYVRYEEAIVFSYTEMGNPKFKPEQLRAAFVLGEFLNLENA